MKFSIGICTYNEEENIGILLNSILKQNIKNELEEIIVVSSGCKDRTEDIVKEIAKKDKRITLIVEKERNGKPSAVNKILKQNKSEIIIFTDGDALPAKGSFDILIDSFTQGIGAVSSKVITLDDKNFLWDYIAKYRYRMFHKINSWENEKRTYFHTSGYLYAFRKETISEIPDILNDDGYIGSMIFKKGWRVFYQPKSKVYIRHPNNLKEFVSQRVRVRLAHLQLMEISGLEMASTNSLTLFNAFFTSMGKNPLMWPIMPFFALVEIYCVIKAKRDYKKDISTTGNWESLESPKKLK